MKLNKVRIVYGRVILLERHIYQLSQKILKLKKKRMQNINYKSEVT